MQKNYKFVARTLKAWPKIEIFSEIILTVQVRNANTKAFKFGGLLNINFVENQRVQSDFPTKMTFYTSEFRSFWSQNRFQPKIFNFAIGNSTKPWEPMVGHQKNKTSPKILSIIPSNGVLISVSPHSNLVWKCLNFLYFIVNFFLILTHKLLINHLNNNQTLYNFWPVVVAFIYFDRPPPTVHILPSSTTTSSDIIFIYFLSCCGG